MTTWRLLIALVASWCLGVAVSAQQHEAQSKPDHMHHRFDDPERYAKSFDESARDTWQMPARVIDALALSPNASVADIGAGTGYFSIRLAEAAPGATVYAVDVEPSMLAHIANVRSAKVSKMWSPCRRAVRALTCPAPSAS